MHPDLQRLIDDLTAPDATTRVAAADALGQWSAMNQDTAGLIEEGVPALIRALDDPAREVRWSAGYALGAVGASEAILALVGAYERADDDTGLRLILVKALGKIGHRDAIPAVLRTLDSADSRCLRVAGGKALARIATPGTVLALLRDRAGADFDASVAAQNMLRALGEYALPGLLAALGRADSASLQLHWEAVNALAEIGGAAVPGVIAVLTAAGALDGVRWAAGEALGYLRTPSVPGLIEALAHPDSEVRRAASYALIAAGDARAVPALLHAVEDADPEVSLNALKALKAIGDPAAVPALRACHAASKVAQAWALAKLDTNRHLHESREST